MGIIINTKHIIGTEPSVDSGELGLFAGVGDKFYLKRSDGSVSEIGGTGSCVILDSNQIVKSKKNSHYFSSNAVQFICESLEDLDHELKEYNSKLFLLYKI